MPLTPEQAQALVERVKRAAFMAGLPGATGVPLDVLRDVAEALPALLSEREEMQRRIADLELSLDAAKDNGDRAGAGYDAANARYEAALSLLREVEWSASGGWEGEYDLCPVCGGAEPERFKSEGPDPDHPDLTPGHAPDCQVRRLLYGP